MEDYSTSNPSLHQLCVGWAMQHLAFLNDAIQEADDFSNLNMMGTVQALQTERRQLIENNAAYRDAAAKLMAGDEPPPAGWSGEDAAVPGTIVLDSLTGLSEQALSKFIGREFQGLDTEGHSWPFTSPTGLKWTNPRKNADPRKPFREVLADWISKMESEAPERLPDGTPRMGMFESEELFRRGNEFIRNSELIDINGAREVIIDGVYVKSNSSTAPLNTLADILRRVSARPTPEFDVNDPIPEWIVNLGMDSHVWAKEFIKVWMNTPEHLALNEDWMEAWFRRALKTGKRAGALVETELNQANMSLQERIEKLIAERKDLRNELQAALAAGADAASQLKHALEQVEVITKQRDQMRDDRNRIIDADRKGKKGKRPMEEDPDEEPTHYVLRSHTGALFVKEAKFFRSQGGHEAEWGKNWVGVVANSLADAKAVFNELQPSGSTIENDVASPPGHLKDHHVLDEALRTFITQNDVRSRRELRAAAIKYFEG